MSDKTVFTFGRLNPPTVGHEKLVSKVKQVAKRLGAEPHVFLSHSQNSKKDPLNYNQKFKYARQAFGNVVYQSNARTVIQIMQELEKMNHKDVVMVVGSDRVQEFRVLLNKYNGKDYTFDSIKVISAGDRDPDAEGVSGMSASKMRAAVSAGAQATFMSGVPSKLSKQSAARMYSDLRSAMNIKEDFDDFDWELWAETVDIENVEIIDEAVMSYAQRIKKARNMKRLAPRFKNLRRIKKFRMADKDRLMKRARKQAIGMFRKKVAGEKGKHYAQLSTSAKISIDKLVQKKMPAVTKLAQRLLPKVRKSEIERLRKARNTTNESLIEKCWDGYKQVGMKKKGGKDVPNCVPESSDDQTDDVADIVPDRIRISMISGSKKRVLNDKFEKMSEQEIAARVSGPSTNQAKKRHAAEKERQRERHRQERERLKTRQAGQVDRSQIRDIRSESLDEAFESYIQLEAKKIPHKLDPKKSLKHAMTDIGLDRDSDGDVDILDKMKKLNPDEITGTEKNTKAIQSFRKKRAEIEKKHTRVGVAYEQKTLDESFQIVVQQPAGYGQIVTAKEAGIEIQAGFALHPSVTEEGGAGEFGTNKLKKKYKKDTPGEEREEIDDD